MCNEKQSWHFALKVCHFGVRALGFQKKFYIENEIQASHKMQSFLKMQCFEE